MESRRHLALQRKAEEERAKALEEDRKMKEEAERRKKEREELTDKRPLKSSVAKKVRSICATKQSLIGYDSGRGSPQEAENREREETGDQETGSGFANGQISLENGIQTAYYPQFVIRVCPDGPTSCFDIWFEF